MDAIGSVETPAEPLINPDLFAKAIQTQDTTLLEQWVKEVREDGPR